VKYTEHDETLRLYELYADMVDPPGGDILAPSHLVCLLRQVAAEYGVSVETLKSDRRTRPLPEIRAEFCKRADALGKYSTTQIGKTINRDHTTVLFALGKLAQKPSYMRAAE
jgi:chromosomal replication initiation ATPase DnaA